MERVHLNQFAGLRSTLAFCGILKRCFVGLCSSVLIPVMLVGIVIAIWSSNRQDGLPVPNPIISVIEAKISKMLGAKAELGEVRLFEMGLNGAKLELGKLRLEMPDHVIAAQSVELGIAWSQLISAVPKVTSLHVQSVDLGRLRVPESVASTPDISGVAPAELYAALTELDQLLTANSLATLEKITFGHISADIQTPHAVLWANLGKTVWERTEHAWAARGLLRVGSRRDGPVFDRVLLQAWLNLKKTTNASSYLADLDLDDVAPTALYYALLGRNPSVLEAIKTKWAGNVRMTFSRPEIWPETALRIASEAGYIESGFGTLSFNRLSAYVTYDPSTNWGRIEELSLLSPLADLRLNGDLSLDPASQDWIAQLNINHLRIAHGDSDVGGTEITHGYGRIRIDDTAKTLSVAQASFELAPEHWLHMTGDIGLEDRLAQLELSAQNMGARTLLRHWPPALLTKLRQWITQNIHQAQLKDLSVSVQTNGTRQPDIFASAGVENGIVSFRPGVPAVQNLSGHLSLVNKLLRVDAHAAKLDAGTGPLIDLAGTSFHIPNIYDITNRRGFVALDARSEITSAIALLRVPGFNLFKAPRIPTDFADGRADVEGVIELNLRRRAENEKKPKPKITLQGVLHDVTARELVPKRILTARELTLRIADERISITGKGKLDTISFDASWGKSLRKGTGPGEVEGLVTIDKGLFESLNLQLPPNAVSGSGLAQVEIDLNQKPPRLIAQSDLAGLSLSLPQIGWTKIARRTGTLRVVAPLKGKLTDLDFSLAAAGLETSGRWKFENKTVYAFDRLRLGDWINGTGVLSLARPGSDTGIDLQLQTGGMNLASLPKSIGSKTSARRAPRPVSASLSRVVLSPKLFLASVDYQKITDETQFEGLLNGRVPVRGNIIETDGRKTINLVGADAGKVFEALRIVEDAIGGTIRMTLREDPNVAGQYFGFARAQKLRLRKASFFTGLLNALSIVGLVDQLASGGLFFELVEAEFRISKDQLTLVSSSFQGPSMGLTLNGTYGFAADSLDMQGVVSPVYMLNRVAGMFRPKGEGLIGIMFGVEGPAREPSISVNPLSLFTPGVLRELLRRPAPEPNPTE